MIQRICKFEIRSTKSETKTNRLLKSDFRSSLPRRRESRKARKDWIPAFAGMTEKTA